MRLSDIVIANSVEKTITECVTKTSKENENNLSTEFSPVLRRA